MILKERSPITREQFLFYEMRITAKLMLEGGDEAIVNRIKTDNLFQYPTERSVGRMARVCIRRLRSMNDATLIEALTVKPSEISKQICLYAMMKQYRIVWEFMVTVIGEKYRSRDMSYGKIDLNAFFSRLQEQHDQVAAWSDTTIAKAKQVLNKILVENEYIDSAGAQECLEQMAPNFKRFLGSSLFHGHGVSGNKEEGVIGYWKALNQGNANAQARKFLDCVEPKFQRLLG